MKLSAVILVLLGATDAIQLQKPAKTNLELQHEGLSELLHLPANTEYPNYPAGAIEQLDDGVCRKTGCG